MREVPMTREEILLDCLRILVRWFVGLNAQYETIDALRKQVTKLEG